MGEGPVIPGKVTRRVETPRIHVSANGLQLLAYVDTGSSVTLLSSKAATRLGVDQQMGACHRKLRGVTNHCLKVLGEVVVPVEVAPGLQITPRVIVVPDEYLSTEILLGMDVLSVADFTMRRGARSLVWGGQTYVIQKSWVYSVSRVKEEERKDTASCVGKEGAPKAVGSKGKELKSQRGDRVSERHGAHSRRKVVCLPGKLTEVRIESRHFQPGQMILVEREDRRKVGACTWPHACFRVDGDRGFILPVVNQGKRSVTIGPGHRLGTYTVVGEQDIEYVDLNGRRLGDKGEVRELVLRSGLTQTEARLCQTHKAILTEEEEEKGVRDVALWDCDVCCWTDRVNSVTTIHNSLVPFSDTAPSTGDRQTRLTALMTEMEWGHLESMQRDKLKKWSAIMQSYSYLTNQNWESSRLPRPT